ncbi:two-component system sporulation sensor kinase B [Salibacterium salarium]|uniref:ATP-binding protein n=1 Tax=Salibacterium salarium TaxID=284579 RepID=UPI00277F62D0|nr:ATP-binding protein [Salibacterium salarium]MDQ0298090.1 two-component system sporulation sensor kinase B [Salibacterium salarium]
MESLLLNVLFIIVFLQLVPLFLELSKHRFSYYQKRWIINTSSSIGIISCILFPIPIMEGYIFDLRLAALTIAGLYGGILTSVLSGVTIGFRFFIGGVGASATIIEVTMLLILLALTTAWFHRSLRKNKLIIGSSIALSAAVIALLNSVFIFGATLDWRFVTMYLVLTWGITVLIIYLYEVFHEYLLINKRVIKAEKMEMVSHLAASVSHEVRNPLTVVRGFLQMIEQEGIPDEKRKKFMRLSMEEIDRADVILGNYLTFARPSPEHTQVLNIEKQIHKTLQIITPLANMNAVQIETYINNYKTRGDEHNLQQCLINIKKNCIEAMPDSGKLRIETSKEESNLILTISDNGNGMTKEELSRVGEPYFTTKGREGTGLGMMAAFKIIETMNGSLNVASVPYEGTSFYIRLPLIESGSSQRDI